MKARQAEEIPVSIIIGIKIKFQLGKYLAQIITCNLTIS